MEPFLSFGILYIESSIPAAAVGVPFPPSQQMCLLEAMLLRGVPRAGHAEGSQQKGRTWCCSVCSERARFREMAKFHQLTSLKGNSKDAEPRRRKTFPGPDSNKHTPTSTPECTAACSKGHISWALRDPLRVCSTAVQTTRQRQELWQHPVPRSAFTVSSLSPPPHTQS